MNHVGVFVPAFRDKTILMLHFQILDFDFVWIYYSYDGNSGSTGPAKIRLVFTSDPNRFNIK